MTPITKVFTLDEFEEAEKTKSKTFEALDEIFGAENVKQILKLSTEKKGCCGLSILCELHPMG